MFDIISNMNPTEQLQRLVAADPAACPSVDEVTMLLHHAQGVRAWLDAFEVACTSRLATLAAAGRGIAPAEVLTDGGRRRGRDAAVVVARAQVCVSMPDLHDALATGVVAACHVDAVARAAHDLSPAGRDALAEMAPSLVTTAAAAPSVESFERSCRDLVRILSHDEGESRLDAQRRRRRRPPVGRPPDGDAQDRPRARSGVRCEGRRRLARGDGRPSPGPHRPGRGVGSRAGRRARRAHRW